MKCLQGVAYFLQHVTLNSFLKCHDACQNSSPPSRPSMHEKMARLVHVLQI